MLDSISLCECDSQISCMEVVGEFFFSSFLIRISCIGNLGCVAMKTTSDFCHKFSVNMFKRQLITILVWAWRRHTLQWFLQDWQMSESIGDSSDCTVSGHMCFTGNCRWQWAVKLNPRLQNNLPALTCGWLQTQCQCFKWQQLECWWGVRLWCSECTTTLNIHNLYCGNNKERIMDEQWNH